MANDEHVAILKKGVAAWNAWRNEWRKKNPKVFFEPGPVDLSGANLREANLRKANLYKANLREADLYKADLSYADLTHADLSRAVLLEANLSEAFLNGADLKGADLIGADLSAAKLIRVDLRGAELHRADLTEADLSNADLSRADFSRADLKGTNLSGAILQGSTLLDTDLTGANLTDCRIYGISAWKLKLEGAKQHNLIITDGDEPTVTVDNIEVAQFIYLMLNNQKVRDVIDTITSKAVLILGRLQMSVRPCSTPYVRNCASVTTSQSYSTSLFQLRGTLPRPSHCLPAWPASSSPT